MFVRPLSSKAECARLSVWASSESSASYVHICACAYMRGRVKRSQDMFRLLGWPYGLNYASIREKDACDLIGNGINLACLASVLGASVVAASAPWWLHPQPQQGCSSSSSGNAKRVSSADVQAAVLQKRRRSVGGVGRSS